MKIAVVGTGGVGGYFGGRIAKAGFNVTFVARGEHLRAVKENGLKVKSILGDFELQNINATDNIKNITGSDLIILAVKAWQVRDVAKELEGNIFQNTTILPLQNGILAAKELSEVLNPQNIINGLCRILSKIDEPGVISHFGIEPTIIFGEMDNNKSERVFKINDVFQKSGITSLIADDIDAELWKKFIGICTSGLLAVTRSTYGELREFSETRDLMYRILSEIYEVSVKAGIKIKPEFVDNYYKFIDSFPYNSTSSLSRDIIDEKPSEIVYQNGTVVKLAEQYGVNVPVNKFIYSCLLPIEIKARNKIKNI